MLSIDEAIEHAREVAERNRKQYKNCPADRRDIEHQTCEQCAEEHEQLAEWLEELKALRNGLKIKCDSLNEALEKGKKIGYNKAIYDFIRKCEMESRVILDEIIHLSYYGLSMRELQRIAEQLKAGGENESK